MSKIRVKFPEAIVGLNAESGIATACVPPTDSSIVIVTLGCAPCPPHIGTKKKHTAHSTHFGIKVQPRSESAENAVKFTAMLVPFVASVAPAPVLLPSRERIVSVNDLVGGAQGQCGQTSETGYCFRADKSLYNFIFPLFQSE